MKKINFLSIIFLTWISGFSQIDLAVYLKRNDPKIDIEFIVDTLKIYKDNVLFKSISNPQTYAFWANVSNGEYRFCYNNLFGEKLERVVTLDKTKDSLGRQINLYIDQLQNVKSNKLFINKLNTGDTLTISLKYSGCFKSESDFLIIYKKKKRLFLSYKNRKRILKERDKEFLIKYETELRNLTEPNFMSTSNGFNEISLNDEKYSFYEPGLFWNGFKALKTELKLE